MVLAEQIKEAASRRDTLEKCLDIERKRMDLQNEEEKTQEPDFWDDAARAQEQLRRVASIKSWITDYDTIRKEVEDLELMPDFLKEGVISEEEMDAHYAQTIAHIEALELRNMLRRDEDKMGAILDINAGAGGTEALDWASMLLRMYTRWCEAHGYKVKTLDYQAGDEVGVKSCTLEIEGDYAYGYLKSENGVHRLVRISPYDASGRRHTSFAAVEVMPEIAEDNSEIELRDDEIKMDVYRSSGAGGQKVNKTSSAVRLTHLPTGIVVSSQVERSHFQNLENCKSMLRAKLAEIKEREHLEKISDIKGVQQKIEWGSQIRSYVFMPYTLAKDTRTGYENSNIQAVMDGDIDGFINAYLAMKAEK